MGSTSEKTRISQKDQALAEVKARQEALTKAGISEKDQARDPKLRAARAELRKAKKRLNAIAARDNHVKEAKEKREVIKAQKKAGGPKKDEGKEQGKGKKPKKEKKEKKADKA